MDTCPTPRLAHSTESRRHLDKTHNLDGRHSTLAHPQPPERRDLSGSGGAERVGLVGGAGMRRPDIGLAEDEESRFLKGGKQF